MKGKLRNPCSKVKGGGLNRTLVVVGSHSTLVHDMKQLETHLVVITNGGLHISKWI